MADTENNKNSNSPAERAQGNAPALRFPGFTEPWQKSTFKDICKITTGSKNTQDKVDGGLYPFYVRSQTVERINDYTFDGEAILTAGDGVGVGKVFHYSTGKIGVHQRVYLLTDFKCDGKYLFHYFSSKFYNRVKRMSAKNSVDSVRMEMIADMPLSLPSYKEQQLIGTLLSKLDERIATQRRLIEDLEKLKSSIIEKIYCSPMENYPRLRISQKYAENWPIYELGNICTRITTKNINNEANRVLTIAAQYGLIDQCLFFNKVVASENLSNYYLLKKGDFAYNKSYSGDYIWGAVKRLDKYESGVLSPLYICFRPNNELVDSDYLLFYFESKKWHKEISEIVVEGARNHGLLNISVKDFFNMHIPLPSIDEQRELSTMIRTIQLKIEHDKTILQRYEQQRSYFLKEMFI